jgi:hypothetical protein
VQLVDEFAGRRHDPQLLGAFGRQFRRFNRAERQVVVEQEAGRDAGAEAGPSGTTSLLALTAVAGIGWAAAGAPSQLGMTPPKISFITRLVDLTAHLLRLD